MLSRNLIIGVVLIGLTAGCTTWAMRTWQSQGYEASVVLATRSNRHLGAQEQRDRYVELINDLEPSTLTSYNDHQLTSMRAHHEKRRAQAFVYLHWKVTRCVSKKRTYEPS